MIKFIKIPDPSNPFDKSTVSISLKEDMTLDEVQEEFNIFLLACGYALPKNSGEDSEKEDSDLE